jgi:hypothetical protein
MYYNSHDSESTDNAAAIVVIIIQLNISVSIECNSDHLKGEDFCL